MRSFGVGKGWGKAELAERNGVWIVAEGAGLRVWHWGLCWDGEWRR